MATRKAPIDSKGGNAQKRRRVEDTSCVSSLKVGSACFDDLNSDCIVHIISYLMRDDMDSVAVCNQNCREARSNESLDQTRSGTIVLTERSSIHSINRAIRENGWSTVFSGNRTHLKIVGVERMHHSSVIPIDEDDSRPTQLAGITSLDLSLPEGLSREVNLACISALLRMCPNTTDLDLSYLQVQAHLPCRYRLWNACSDARRVTWNGCNRLSIAGFCEPNSTASVTDLYLNNVVFATAYSLEHTSSVYGNNPSPSCMLRAGCPIIERLSIKNASWVFSEEPELQETLPQEVILKFVRSCPTLRWLCSDLTEDNVAMMKQERPEVTFVSE